MEHLVDDHEDHPYQNENNQKLWYEKDVRVSEFWGKWIKTEATTWSEFPSGGKITWEHLLGSEDRDKSGRGWLWESQSKGPSRKNNDVSVVLW